MKYYFRIALVNICMFRSKLYTFFNKVSFTDGQKSFVSNMMNVCRCFSSIFSNQLITSVVFFYSLSFSFSHKQMLILSNIDLLIPPTSLLAGFVNLIVEWLTKFSFWSFKVIKQLLVPLVSTLSNISAPLAYFIPSLFIISSIPSVVLLYVAVTALSRR